MAHFLRIEYSRAIYDSLNRGIERRPDKGQVYD